MVRKPVKAGDPLAPPQAGSCLAPALWDTGSDHKPAQSRSVGVHTAEKGWQCCAHTACHVTLETGRQFSRNTHKSINVKHQNILLFLPQILLELSLIDHLCFSVLMHSGR